jgi:hypothetical protein
VNKPWQDFADEIARCNDAGRAVDFWWRDDDAGAPHAAFARLSTLAAQSRVPLGLAVIPQRAQPALFGFLGDETAVLQHGVDHRNRAPQDQKPSEFAASEAIEVALERVVEGAERLTALAGSRVLPVLVPPWNRFPQHLLEKLSQRGIRGFSAFGPRARAEPAPGVRQVNTHVDIIGWKRGRTFVGAERALSEAAGHLEQRRTDAVDATEPTGWLTHHERHDEVAWRFLAELFEFSRRQAGVRWLHPRELFAPGEGP